ncbi:MAG: hypothetical protein ABI592_02165 [Acidobacteriota bacterium]
MSSPGGRSDSGKASAAGARRDPAPRATGAGSAIRRWIGWPEAAFLLVTTAAGVWGAGRWTNPFGDPGFSWSAVHRVAHGERLYRDIFLSYTPLSIESLALVARVFGESSVLWTFVNWIPAVAAGFLLLAASRGILAPLERAAVATAAMALSLFVSGNGRLVYPYYPGVAHALLLSLAALCFLRDSDLPPMRRAFFAALLAGLAFGCKQELGVAAFAAVASAVVTSPRAAPRWLAGAAAGGLAGLAATVVFLLSAPSIDALRLDSHFWPLALKVSPDLQPLFRSVAGVRYPNWPLAMRSSAFLLLLRIGLLLIVALLVVRPRARRAWIPVGALFAVLAAWWLYEGESLGNPSPFVCLSMLVSFAVAGIAFFRRETPQRPFLVGLGIFAGLAGVRTAFSPFTTGAYDGPARLAASLTWIVFLCVLLPAIFLPDSRARAIARPILAAAAILATVSPAWDGIRSLRFPDRTEVATPRGNVYVTGREAGVLSLLSRALVPGERVFLVPESNGVDVLWDVRDVSPLIDVMPGWVEPGVERALMARFEREMPSAIVWFDRPMPEYGIEPFGRGYGRELAAWCEQHYAAVAATPGVRILRLKTTRPVGESPRF